MLKTYKKQTLDQSQILSTLQDGRWSLFIWPCSKQKEKSAQFQYYFEIAILFFEYGLWLIHWSIFEKILNLKFDKKHFNEWYWVSFSMIQSLGWAGFKKIQFHYPILKPDLEIQCVKVNFWSIHNIAYIADCNTNYQDN